MVKVTFVKAEKDYRLLVRLSNGRSGYFDVSPYYFEQVRIAFGGVACLGNKILALIQLSMKCNLLKKSLPSLDVL